jgi:hypothetical protein
MSVVDCRLTDSVQLREEHIVAAVGRAARLLLSNTLAPPAVAATPSAWQLQRLLASKPPIRQSHWSVAIGEHAFISRSA